MSTYKEINGQKIQNVSSDPPASFTGQVWYNSTSGALKVDTGTLVSSWATGGDLNQNRYILAGAGTQTAALAFGGGTFAASGLTELWNGTNWTEVNDLNEARSEIAGAGATNTASLAFGGDPAAAVVTSATEIWNGTNWSNDGSMNVARNSLAGAGTNTAALAFGGDVNPGVTAATEEFINPGIITKTITTS